MNLNELHKVAMEKSFLAKKARLEGNENTALRLYEEAAKLETEVATYYLDKNDLEPTRSILIRSAAFLNLKAGLIEDAQKFIFFGLTNISDERIRSELYEALEFSMAFSKLDRSEIAGNLEYIYHLRRKSVLYSIEPKSHEFSTVVSLEMVSEFAENYTKSLKAYSHSKFVDYFSNKYKSAETVADAAEEFSSNVKPLLSNAGFGSFKFSIASDFLGRVGEHKDIVTLRSNVITQYHNEIFVRDYTDEQIEHYKTVFNEDEINNIFRPIFKIRSNQNDYKVSYYDRETFKKEYIAKSRETQKKKLLPIRSLSPDDIGVIESTLTHTRETGKGHARKIISRQQFKSYEFDHPIKMIEAKGYNSILLNEEIILSVSFSSEHGFYISYEDLGLADTAPTFEESLNTFFLSFRNLILHLNSIPPEGWSELERAQWKVIKSLISNPSSILG